MNETNEKITCYFCGDLIWDSDSRGDENITLCQECYDDHYTQLIQAGVNPRVVQQRLGHSDVNITLNTYTHVLPEMDIDAAEKLDSIMLKKA